MGNLDKNKPYFLEKTANVAIQNIVQNNNVLIRSLPGMGLYTLVESISSSLEENPTTYTISIYPYEGFATDYKDIDRIVIEKFKNKSKKELPNLYSVAKLVEYLKDQNINLIIILHKIHQFKQPSIYMNYFDSLKRGSFSKICILVSAEITVSKKIANNELKLSAKDILFPGFIENGEYMIRKLAMERKVSIANPKDIVNLVGGHLGLMKALIAFSTNSSGKAVSSNLNLDTLLDDIDIKRRLTEIFMALKAASINFSSGSSELEDLGLYYKGKPFELFSHYFMSSFNLDPVAKLLTKTEQKIFKVLKDNLGSYVELEQILYSLGETSYYESSDWALYKHINNLNKKIKKVNYVIVNKRGGGYLLQHEFDAKSVN